MWSTTTKLSEHVLRYSPILPWHKSIENKGMCNNIEFSSGKLGVNMTRLLVIHHKYSLDFFNINKFDKNNFPTITLGLLEHRVRRLESVSRTIMSAWMITFKLEFCDYERMLFCYQCLNVTIRLSNLVTTK